ncbi:MAG: DUF3843 family protein [Verrucomicrobiota bacterium]|nr:DUF3843 family protein [Verrucomicrobiota bacterium]
MAVLLVEWAEDIHKDLGLWRALEAHQCQCFGTPLPFIVAPTDAGPEGFDARRIQYLLWNLWPCFNQELMLSPTHQDLKRLALMRHSDRRLTDKIYTDENLLGTWSAFDALPNFTERASQIASQILVANGQSESSAVTVNGGEKMKKALWPLTKVAL